MRHGWEVEHFGTPKSATDIGDAPGDSPTSPVMKSEGPGEIDAENDPLKWPHSSGGSLKN